MEVRKITKTDGQRLFVEISTGLKEGKQGLPSIKKGDEVLVTPIRKLSAQQMQNLVGKYVSYWDIDPEEGTVLFFDGEIQKNDEKFWDEEEPEDGKYVLIDYALRPDGKGVAIDSFDDLNDVFDLKILQKETQARVKCNNPRCKKEFIKKYMYCPHCGSKNKQRR
jgi:hypothetical protein